MTIENAITILAVIGSALTVYFNFRKFGDRIKDEAEWRTSVNIDMKNMLQKMTEMLASHRDVTELIHGLMEARVKLEHEIDKMKAELKIMWKRIDEQKAEIVELKRTGK